MHNRLMAESNTAAKRRWASQAEERRINQNTFVAEAVVGMTGDISHRMTKGLHLNCRSEQ